MAALIVRTVSLLRQVDRQVHDAAGGNRHAQGDAGQLAFQVGNDQAHRLGGAGRGGDDVQRRGPRAIQVLVRHGPARLVIGVGVNGGHQARFDAEGLVQDLGDRGQAVGGAAGVGDALHVGR